MRKQFLLMILFIISHILYSQSNIYLTIDSTIHSNKINLLVEKPFLSNQYYDADIQLDYTKINIDSPSVMLINGGRSCPLYQRIYMTPGDSLVISKEKVESDSTIFYLTFSGKNSAHYNYYALEYYSLNRYKPNYIKEEGLDVYKNKVKLWKNKRLQFLERFNEKETLSKDFLEYVRDDIQNGYVFYLYDPLAYSGVQKHQLPLSYFDTISINGDERSQYYRVASSIYIKEYTDDVYSNIDKAYKTIKKEFRGKQLDYMTAALIGIYSIKQDNSYNFQLNNIIDSALISITEPAYIDYIKQSRDFYMLFDKYFPDNILDNTYLKAYGKTDKITLREVFDSYKGKPLYIDIWASWCGPCREDISKSRKVKDFLHSSGVEYLYFSTDQKEASWLKVSQTDKITENQFLICDIEKSPLAGFLSFNYIPFYILLDKDHKIKTSLAPRPIPENLEEIKKLIESIQKTTTKYY